MDSQKERRNGAQPSPGTPPTPKKKKKKKKKKEGDSLNLLEISRLKSITKIQYIGGIENYWNVHYKTNHNLSNKNMN